MEELASAATAFFSWPAPLYLVIGMLLGALFGLLPGLGGAQVIALLTPLTFGMDPRIGITFIISAMGAVGFGGSVPAILINTPGTGQDAATILDGFPLARKGKAGMALGAGAMASCVGGLIGALVLLILIPVGKQVVTAFSYPEIFMMAIMGISIIVAVSQGSMWKGFIAGGLGLMLSSFGFDPVTGALRYTFGIEYLWDGIKIVPAVIGLFAIPEAVDLFLRGGSISEEPITASRKDVIEGIKAVFRHWWLFIRCSVIGTLIGIIPGVGGAVACWVAYGHAVQTEKKDPRFGSGDIRGVIAPEAATNAKDGGALVPTVVFGIPGSVETAVILGTLTLQGVVPGPKLMLERADVVYVMVLALAASNVLVSFLGLLFANQLARLSAVPTRILAPIVFSLCLLGAYTTEGKFGDVVLSLVIGVMAYAMRTYGFSRVPVIIALVLGAVAQETFHQTLQSMGPEGFFTRPMSLALLLITIAMVAYPPLAASRKRKVMVSEAA